LFGRAIPQAVSFQPKPDKQCPSSRNQASKCPLARSQTSSVI
jgi:hypothetical protein